MSNPAPFDNGTNGGDRDAHTGRFRPGNRAARGRSHPHARAAVQRHEKLQEMLLDDWAQTCVKLLVSIVADKKARPSDRIAAAREFLDRYDGKPSSVDWGIIERLADLESHFELLAKGTLQ